MPKTSKTNNAKAKLGNAKNETQSHSTTAERKANLNEAKQMTSAVAKSKISDNDTSKSVLKNGGKTSEVTLCPLKSELPKSSLRAFLSHAMYCAQKLWSRFKFASNDSFKAAPTPCRLVAKTTLPLL